MKAEYKCLPKQSFSVGNKSISPIAHKDRFTIMHWRNEQINILRQKELLTAEKQDNYFNNVINQLFDQITPSQLLFGFYENGMLIGYGGLVHIDWEIRNAEISFITATERNNKDEVFCDDFSTFLELVFLLAFDTLNFIKLHTTFYDIQHRVLYKKVIEEQGFISEGRLENHIMINGKIENVLIYSRFNPK